MQTTGLHKIAEGLEAEMFDWEGGRVLRLYRPEMPAGQAVRQARLLDIANACGIPVPSEYGTIDVDGREGLVLEKLDGPDLMTDLGSKPWKMFRVAGITGRIHARINSTIAPLDLESTKERYRRIISHSDRIPDDLRGPTLRHLDLLSDGDRLCHGDIHPANVMWRHGEPAVIDWSNASRGPAEADFYRSYMMTTAGGLPPGTPLLIRWFSRLGRRFYRDSYERAYDRILTLDRSIVESWRRPVAVARLAEGIQVERAGLLRLIGRLK